MWTQISRRGKLERGLTGDHHFQQAVWNTVRPNQLTNGIYHDMTFDVSLLTLFTDARL